MVFSGDFTLRQKPPPSLPLEKGEEPENLKRRNFACFQGLSCPLPFLRGGLGWGFWASEKTLGKPHPILYLMTLPPSLPLKKGQGPSGSGILAKG